MSLQEMLEKRNKLVADARALNDKVVSESRDFTGEEQVQYEAMFKEINSLNDQIKREQELRTLETHLAASQGTVAAGREVPGGESGKTDDRAKAQIQALRSFILGGVQGMAPEETRALSMGTDAAGGYIVPPEQFVAQLIQAVDDLVYVRQWATKFSVVQAASMGVPSLDTNPADADWTSELLIGSEDSTMTFGKRELTPHPLAKYIKVSNKLLRASPIDPEVLVRDRLAYKFAVAEEKAFFTGTGASQPLGLFTASANGIDTDRDYSTGNSETAIAFDGLIGAKFTLKPQYWRNARWLFHRDALAQIAKLKDGEGQYIWRENVMAGEPPILLGLPFFMSEYAPNTFTTGLYVGILGDFSNFWIVDALTMIFQRLVELFAATNQVGFIGRRELDGMPVLSEAFVRVTLA
jgi:HK97 family phage major capsid protein